MCRVASVPRNFLSVVEAHTASCRPRGGCAVLHLRQRALPAPGGGGAQDAIAAGLSSPRHVVIDTAGNLLVAEGGSGSVQRLVLKDDGTSVCVTSKSVTKDRSTSHGIALNADGKTLFTSSLSSIIKVARGFNGNIDTATTSQSVGRSMITFSISKSLTTHAYVAFQGSWNRNPADGYRVARVTFKDGPGGGPQQQDRPDYDHGEHGLMSQQLLPPCCVKYWHTVIGLA
ncbi:hypothetical protein B0T25DRAFT_630036 [Lasiosphaeria hispida]|uniref:Pyrroloquinoline quinone-dependent pyranose dehydrogenase beta-propeller domain-containing protein n=1 Tax=Lasiosphaeria hispida TaxID=260671 RepID=A0AAJ0HKZ2_9PEZI|nr:hypothetical protein B0T25DRAFT_630036 [Lasiosphaeria hispida]